jgi:hypothetical protein
MIARRSPFETFVWNWTFFAQFDAIGGFAGMSESGLSASDGLKVRTIAGKSSRIDLTRWDIDMSRLAAQTRARRYESSLMVIVMFLMVSHSLKRAGSAAGFLYYDCAPGDGNYLQTSCT